MPEQPKPFNSSIPHQVGDTILGASDALAGLVGIDTGSGSWGSKAGQILGAAVPVIGAAKGSIHPAVRELLSVLEGAPAERNLGQEVAGSRVMGARIHNPQSFKVPEGFELPSNFDPSATTPRNFGEASLKQEGFKGGFGMSPANEYQQAQTRPSYRKLADKTVDPRQLELKSSASFPEIRQVEQALSVKGLSDLSDVVTQPGNMGSSPKSIRQPQTGQASSAYSTTRNKATPEIVRDIRRIVPKMNAAGVKTAVAKYPDLNEATIRDIINRNSWNWVK